MVRTTWPSAGVDGSVTAQTNELLSLLQKGKPVLIKAGVRVVSRGMLVNSMPVDIAGENGAIIEFSGVTDCGFRFLSCPSASITNMTVRWPGTGRATRNNSWPGIYFAGSANSFIDNVTVIRSPGAGVLFGGCIAPKATNVTVQYTGADGIHFANCGSVYAANLTTSYTGDDGIAFVDYADKPAPGGFTLVGGKISESLARGLSIVGASRGTATDIVIDGTASNNIHVEQDITYKTLFPSQITVRRVTATRAGGTLPKGGNQYGINIVRATAVLMDDISVSNGTSIGISVVSSNNVTLNNVRTTTSVNNGLRVQGTVGCVLNKVKITDVVSQYMAITDSSNVTGDIELIYKRDSTLGAAQIANTKGIDINALTFVGFPVNTLKFISTSNSGTLVMSDTPPATMSLVAGIMNKVSQTYNGVRQASDSLKISTK
ncbi:hypothetical protein [Duganella aceris]|uniref:Right handed beta helix domain-containing protein n=1 Tax=Duganella aceris TaxID=2703883 RepID=A0ABX0FU92_9BURK|nr:hypothetical protein [Duganella aceris]NGZ88033.1 hypothetical protein [Duganella aceris]